MSDEIRRSYLYNHAGINALWRRSRLTVSEFIARYHATLDDVIRMSFLNTKNFDHHSDLRIGD